LFPVASSYYRRRYPSSGKSCADQLDKKTRACVPNTFPTIGYCVEMLPVSNQADPSSVTRSKYGGHLIVRVASKGSWDPIREKYLREPLVFEIWHPENEATCTLEASGEV